MPDTNHPHWPMTLEPEGPEYPRHWQRYWKLKDDLAALQSRLDDCTVLIQAQNLTLEAARLQREQDLADKAKLLEDVRDVARVLEMTQDMLLNHHDVVTRGALQGCINVLNGHAPKEPNA